MVKPYFAKKNLKNSILKGFLFLGGLILINLILDRYFRRFDFTDEKRFTLSSTSIRILESLKEPISIKVFLEGDFPGPFKRLKNETEEFLSELKAYSHGNLKFSFINPLESSGGKASSLPDSLYKYGIQPTNIQVKTKEGNTQKEIFPGAFIQNSHRMMAVNLMQNQNQLGGGGDSENLLNHSVEGLEYIFVDAIKKVSEENLPLVGLLGGDGEMFGPKAADMVKTLKTSYRLGKVNLSSFPLDSLIKIKVLILVKPSQKFSETQKYKLDQYLMYGGKILGFIDHVNADLDSMGKNGSILAFANNLNLDDFLFRLGIRINYNLVRDLNCAPIPVVNGPAEQGSNQSLQPWVYYPLGMPTGENPLVRNLDPIRLEFTSTLDTIAVKGIKKTFLLSTSPYTKMVSTPFQISLREVSAPAEDTKTFNQGKKNLAILVEGSFKSSFQNRTIEGADASLPFLSKSIPTSIIIVSNGNLPLNQINSLEKSIYPLGYDKYSGQVFGNKIFLQNAVEYLSGNSDVLQLRNKGIKLRLINKLLVEEERGYHQIMNFFIPILWVICTGLAFGLYRWVRYAKS